VVRSSALMEGLIALFETLWRFAYPLDVLQNDADENPSADSICDDDRRLLALLAAGVPDAIIGRQLGISPNTVQRRIHALMARLGAATRFQGLHTALHGWINTPSRTAQTAR